MSHEQAFCRFELKAAGSKGEIEGLGSVFNNVDHGDDVILPGAFAKSLEQKLPAMLWQHQHDKVPGKWISAEETKEGLQLKGVFANTPLGQEAYELTKMEAVTGLSIGFTIPEGGAEFEKNVRVIKEVDLWEVSPVTFPMNELARVRRVKSKIAHGKQLTIREFEQFLRDAGYSRRAAESIARDGYKAVPENDRDDLSGVLNHITHLRNVLK